MPKPTIYGQFNEEAYVPPQPQVKVVPFPAQPEHVPNIWHDFEDDEEKLWEAGWWSEKPVREKAAILTLAALGLGSVGLTLNNETVGQGMVQRFHQLEQIVGLRDHQAKNFKSSTGLNVNLPTMRNRVG